MPNEGPVLTRGRYRIAPARGAADIQAAQALRTASFATAAPDRDDFDDTSLHMLVTYLGSGTPVCCFRLLPGYDGIGPRKSYAAQFYDLDALFAGQRRIAELGRFCLRPGWHDPDILRIAWAALTRIVDYRRIDMLIGCTSFAGLSPHPYRAAFDLLAARHLAPDCWAPRPRAPEVIRFARQDAPAPDRMRAMQQMPPLLRSYLTMGGRVGDHAVVDRQMGTLHVFTGMEISAIPAARQRLLRAVAG